MCVGIGFYVSKILQKYYKNITNSIDIFCTILYKILCS